LEYNLIFILAIDAFLDSFWDFGNCTMKMMFDENNAYRKVANNSLIYLMLNFGGIWPYSLRVMTVSSWVPEIVVLWNLWTRLYNYACLTWLT
jgi:hypothetical protein